MLLIFPRILRIAPIVGRNTSLFYGFHLLILKLNMCCFIHSNNLISNIRFTLFLLCKTAIHCTGSFKYIIRHNLWSLCFLFANSTGLWCCFWHEKLISWITLFLNTVILNINLILITCVDVLTNNRSLAWSDGIFYGLMNNSFTRFDLYRLLMILNAAEYRNFINI